MSDSPDELETAQQNWTCPACGNKDTVLEAVSDNEVKRVLHWECPCGANWEN